MPNFEKLIECPACRGAGVYVGMAERGGAALVCYKCKGTGAYQLKIEYEEFTGRKERPGVKRVYLSGYGYVIAPKKLDIRNIGEVDLSLEGVRYEDFINGKTPEHIETLACPMLADQSACHAIKGFTDGCEKLHGGTLLGLRLTSCNYYPNRSECWKRFREGGK
jgi:hypothetical protein